ncbi:MAG: M42 family metallopeptidase [bacterium]
MNKNELRSLLKDLVAIPGITGHEKGVREYITKKLSKTRAIVEVNNIGIVTAIFEGKDKKKAPALLDAHMDEVGYIVQYIDKSGFLKVINFGNIDLRVLPSQKVEVHTTSGKKYPGVVGMLPPHVQSGAATTVLPLDQLAVDCGFNSDADVKKAGIRVGSAVTFNANYTELANDKISSKAIDDRGGCAVLLALAEHLNKSKTNRTIVLSFSVQEEGGGKAIATVVQKIKPEYALVVESTTACDTPGISDEKKVTTMGNGVAFTVADAGTYVFPETLELFIKIAEKNKIKYQFKTPRYGGTNAGELCISYEGVKTGIAAVPSRYIHSPVSVVDMNDLMQLFEFAKAYASNI